MKPEAEANKKLNNAKYCTTYRAKKLSGIREKDKERKKFEREYAKYVDQKKYELLKKKDRERKRRAKERREEQQGSQEENNTSQES